MPSSLQSSVSTVARFVRIRARKAWKRLRYPRTFNTPVLAQGATILLTVIYEVRFRRSNYDGFQNAPLSRRQRFWESLEERETNIELPNLPTAEEIFGTCREINERTGTWPISFSHPRNFNRLDEVPDWKNRRLKSDIVPGTRYSYSVESEYLRNYESSRFGLSHKKGGWDCYRHLEILAAGAIPVLPDAAHIPDETMVHYPKAALRSLASALPSLEKDVPIIWRESLIDFSIKNLSSSSMANYVLKAAGVGKDDTVLFLDRAVVEKPDYLSLMTLIGLKQVIPERLKMVFEVPYIYSDFNGLSRNHWGLGFGYSRVLSPDLRLSQTLAPSKADEVPDFSATADWLVVGNITRNRKLAEAALNRFDPSRTIWIHGEDAGPTAPQRSAMSQMVGTVFVRELDGNL